MPGDVPPNTYLTQGIDTGAREDIGKIEERLKAIETMLSDLAHEFWGDSIKRDNGVRSRVRKHGRVLAHLIKRVDGACADVEKHLKEEDMASAKDIAIEVAKINAESESRKGWKTMLGPIIIAVIVLIGQIFNSVQSYQLQRELRAPSAPVSKTLP